MYSVGKFVSIIIGIYTVSERQDDLVALRDQYHANDNKLGMAGLA